MHLLRPPPAAKPKYVSLPLIGGVLLHLASCAPEDRTVPQDHDEQRGANYRAEEIKFGEVRIPAADVARYRITPPSQHGPSADFYITEFMPLLLNRPARYPSTAKPHLFYVGDKPAARLTEIGKDPECPGFFLFRSDGPPFQSAYHSWSKGTVLFGNSDFKAFCVKQAELHYCWIGGRVGPLEYSFPYPAERKCSLGASTSRLNRVLESWLVRP